MFEHQDQIRINFVVFEIKHKPVNLKTKNTQSKCKKKKQKNLHLNLLLIIPGLKKNCEFHLTLGTCSSQILLGLDKSY